MKSLVLRPCLTPKVTRGLTTSTREVKKGPRVAARPAVASLEACAPAVLPPLQALLNAFVCADCSGLYVGGVEHQEQVVTAFFDLAAAFNLEHGQGYVLRALLAGDWSTARQLGAGFDAYNAALTLIHSALDRLPDLAPSAPSTM